MTRPPYISLMLGALLLSLSCVSEDLHIECDRDGDCPTGRLCAFRNCVTAPRSPCQTGDDLHTTCAAAPNAEAVACTDGLCHYDCLSGFTPLDPTDTTRSAGCGN